MQHSMTVIWKMENTYCHGKWKKLLHMSPILTSHMESDLESDELPSSYNGQIGHKSPLPCVVINSYIEN